MLAAARDYSRLYLVFYSYFFRVVVTRSELPMYSVAAFDYSL